MFQPDLPFPDFPGFPDFQNGLAELPESSLSASLQPTTPTTLDSPRGTEPGSSVSSVSSELGEGSLQSSLSEGVTSTVGGEELCDLSDWASYDL